MAMECLIINIGSASKKYALYHDEVPVLTCHFELSTEGALLTLQSETETKTETITLPEYDHAIAVVIRKIEEAGHQVPQLCAVRVVAPGTYFQTHRAIDEEYLCQFAEAEPMAPLHITSTRKELELLREILPNAMIVAASDSAFHANMPEVAANYALPEKLRVLGIRRFGYHGLSVASISAKLRALPTGMPERVIVCHLGSGCSITALRNGSTVDTTMGFTPLEGLPMRSRSGNIDASVIFALLRNNTMTAPEIEKLLNTESGLLGLSQDTGDMKKIIAQMNEGDVHARFAFDFFVSHVKKTIGAYAALLGGVDALVFTGTMGERAFTLRSAACEGLDFLGIRIDSEQNCAITGGKDGLISAHDSPIAVHVMVTDEASVIQQILTEIKKP